MVFNICFPDILDISRLIANMSLKSISNWGNYPRIKANLLSFSTEEELKNILQNTSEIIPRGKGRCYGDSSLNTNIISTLKFNRILDFNDNDGTITCESGVTLEEILNIFVPRGWFLPVTPGTKLITTGGAIASDVHGKNHHKTGSISNHLINIRLMLGNGSIIDCSREKNSDLFWATCGGMGLTGIILQSTFKLKKIETSYIYQESIKAQNLDEIMDLFEESKEFTHSVAWIDCLSKGKSLGRSIIMRGEHATIEDIKKTNLKKSPLVSNKSKSINIPIYFPNWTLNALSVKSFNILYYNKQLNKKLTFITDYNKFFYPLDSLNNWNRIYGKRGFLQYQVVLPKNNSYEGLKKILGKISKSGYGSFLAVLKLFGKQNDLISFPMEGYTLALDFPASTKVFKLLNELDDIVLNYNGRLYLTKDARMNQETFLKSYKNATTFKEIKHKFDTDNKFQSLQSKRIGI